MPESPADLLLAVTAPDAPPLPCCSTVDDCRRRRRSTVCPRARARDPAAPRRADGSSTLELQLVDPALLRGLRVAWSRMSPRRRSAQPRRHAPRCARGWRACSLWQRMLSRGARGLSARRQRGLWGELGCSPSSSRPPLGIDGAVRTWTGPEGACTTSRPRTAPSRSRPQPRTSRRSCASTASASSTTPPCPRCTCLHLSLEVRHRTRRDAARRSSTSPRDSSGGPPRRPFEDRLLAYGYIDMHEPTYTADRLQLREAELFTVADGIPTDRRA